MGEKRMNISCVSKLNEFTNYSASQKSVVKSCVSRGFNPVAFDHVCFVQQLE